MTESGFDQVQVHVDQLSGKVHAVPTKATDMAADAARIVLDMALRSGDGIPDVLVVDHDPKFTSALFKEFTRRIGSSLLIGSAYHKNTNAKAERVNGVLGDTLRAFANGRKDDWDVWLLHAVFAMNNAASTLGGYLTPFSTFQVGDQVILRTKELLDAAEVGKLRQRWEGPFPVARGCGRRRQHIHADPLCAVQVQSDGQRRPAQALLPSAGPAPLPWTGHRSGAGGGVRGGAAPQPQDGPRPDLLPGAVAGPRLGG